MKKRYKSGFLIPTLTAAALLIASQGFAAQGDHPDVPLLNAAGTQVGQYEAYSPKMTCAGCHFNCATGESSTDATLYCGATGMGTQWNCDTSDCPDYGFGDHISIHTQGIQILNGLGDPEVVWQANEVLSYAHGATASRHANAGRNEDYSAEQRHARHDRFFTNSPGMFGKW